jgi:hypothetical protein
VPVPRRYLGLLLAGALGVAAPAAAQSKKDFRGHVLNTPALAGQSVPVLTLGAVSADSTVARDSTLLVGWRTRGEAITRFDDILGPWLSDNAPDVKWVLPAELRKIAKRAPSLVPDPDRMGHSVMASPHQKRLVEPLASRLRQLVAYSDARQALLPSTLTLTGDSVGVAVEVAMELVDARTGNVLWRTYAAGKGRTPDAAVRSAIATIVPLEFDQ